MESRSQLLRPSRPAAFVNATRALTPWLRVGRFRARLEFKAADLWIGAYTAPDESWASGTVWICVLPGLPIHIDWWHRRG